ncbi:MAG: hypothetical protein ACFFAX_12580 [Promethearchaeota archaeon]
MSSHDYGIPFWLIALIENQPVPNEYKYIVEGHSVPNGIQSLPLTDLHYINEPSDLAGYIYVPCSQDWKE